jgi:hypothetical protein
MTPERRCTTTSIALIGLGFVALLLFFQSDRTQMLWLRLSELCYLAGFLGLMFTYPWVHDRGVVVARWLALISLFLAFVLFVLL